jgi:hypothetical protein
MLINKQRKSMMKKIEIKQVNEGPIPAGSFDTNNGTLYKTAWKVCGSVDGGPDDIYVIEVGAKSDSSCPNGKYVEAGKTICANKVTEYQGEKKIYMDGKATKAENGEAWTGGNSSPSTSSAPNNAPQQSGDSHPNGMAIGCCLNNATLIAIAEKGLDGEVSVDRIKEVAGRLLSVSTELEGINTQPTPQKPAGEPAVSSDSDKDAILLLFSNEVKPEIVKIGLWDKFKEKGIGVSTVVGAWKGCGNNMAQFAVQLSGLLGIKQEEEPVAEAVDENLPF